MTDPLVTPEWLAAHLPDVVVLDATYYLPPDPARSRSDFETARVPGARLFEIDEIADRSSGLPHMMPDTATFAEAMAALGIDGRRPVVVYDRSTTHFSAPRVWFTLRLFGLESCFVLDGGLPGWIGGGHPVEGGPATWEAVARRDWRFEADRVVSGATLAEGVAAGEVDVLDARARDRFDGRAPEPRPGLISGHMPGSRCIPFVGLTGDDGRFVDGPRLREIFQDLESAAPVLSCGSGMTACVLALGLERIGLRARLYDASWAEWGLGELGAIDTA